MSQGGQCLPLRLITYSPWNAQVSFGGHTFHIALGCRRRWTISSVFHFFRPNLVQGAMIHWFIDMRVHHLFAHFGSLWLLYLPRWLEIFSGCWFRRAHLEKRYNWQAMDGWMVEVCLGNYNESESGRVIAFFYLQVI